MYLNKYNETDVYTINLFYEQFLLILTPPNPPLGRVSQNFFPAWLAKPQLSKPKLDIPKLGLGNEEGFETDSRKGEGLPRRRQAGGG